MAIAQGFSTHFRFSGVVNHVTTCCLSLQYICLGCPPRHQIFRKTSKLSYYFHIVKKYIRYNNTYSVHVVMNNNIQLYNSYTMIIQSLYTDFTVITQRLYSNDTTII